MTAYPLDCRNTNTLWASVMAETLWRLGLQTVVICPGSRSAPLAVAFAQHPALEAIPVLDERSAAFFALGIARRSRVPVGLICTSGTAGANFFPAIIEAQESQVPLLVLTADRPPELRHCHAGQAIEQIYLYGTHVNWFAELALPDPQLLAYLRQTLIQAWERAIAPGPVHLNIPLREPLAPIPDPALEPLVHGLDVTQFFQQVQPLKVIPSRVLGVEELPLQTWLQSPRGLIVAGPAIPACAQTYCQAIAQLSKLLGWPILAEGLSPLRNYAGLTPNLVTTYDIALRNESLAQALAPSQILRIGELPTSKSLRTWLQSLPVPQWIVEASNQTIDPLHSSSIHLRTSVEALVSSWVTAKEIPREPHPVNPYLKTWLTLESTLCQLRDETLQHTPALRESKVAWLLSQTLPEETLLFIANSMPVRDIELFWSPGDRRVRPFFNRGANGIDGTLSSALGMAHQQQPSVLLTGDLALLHDTNGFLLQPYWKGHLTIVLVNNAGGGIFGMLPIADFPEVFEPFFATPQRANFATLCQAYGVEHHQIESWDRLIALLNPLPASRLRVLEIQCDRTLDAQWRKTHLHEWATQCAQIEAVKTAIMDSASHPG